MTESTTRQTWARRFFGACADMAAGDRKNLRRATSILLAWSLSYVGAALALTRGLVHAGPAAYLTAGLPIALAVAGVLAWGHFLRHADELQRKIQLEAMALGFGGGFVISYGLSLLERAGLPPVDATTPYTLMVLCYIVGILASARRYA